MSRLKKAFIAKPFGQSQSNVFLAFNAKNCLLILIDIIEKRYFIERKKVLN